MLADAMSFDVEAFSGHAQLCACCRTENLYLKNIAAAPVLARRGLESVQASRCFSCGDVRLVGTYWDDTERLDLRGDLDYIALVMTEIAAEECHGTRQ